MLPSLMKEQFSGACDRMQGRWKRREEGSEQDKGKDIKKHGEKERNGENAKHTNSVELLQAIAANGKDFQIFESFQSCNLFDVV